MTLIRRPLDDDRDTDSLFFQPFCLLGKSARGASAANLIGQATAAPGVYVFSELLNLNSIQEVSEIYRLTCLKVADFEIDSLQSLDNMHQVTSC